MQGHLRFDYCRPLCDQNQRSVLYDMASIDEAVQLAVKASPLEMTMRLLYELARHNQGRFALRATCP
jgi:hypothetical protein